MRLIAVILVVAFSGAAVGQDFGGHALFVRTPDADPGKKKCERTLASPRGGGERQYSCPTVAKYEPDHKLNGLQFISSLESPAGCCPDIAGRRDGAKYPRVDSGDLPAGRT